VHTTLSPLKSPHLPVITAATAAAPETSATTPALNSTRVACDKAVRFLSFPYVCPEPVLVNDQFLVLKKGKKTTVF
jgi:hypothetical protein